MSRSDLRGRTPNQLQYLRNILAHDITFGIGPAGTGKTFLAVACAVDALERSGVQRIVLTRPAVEAGERLGFLPGDLAQKVDPYLRPLYDALYDLMGFDRVTAAFDKGLLEIAPLAFMSSSLGLLRQTISTLSTWSVIDPLPLLSCLSGNAFSFAGFFRWCTRWICAE